MGERDPEVETEAARILGYTPDQVKRKTIAELKKELKEARPETSRHDSGTSSKTKLRNVTFAPTQESQEAPRSRGTEGRKKKEIVGQISLSPTTRRSRSWSSEDRGDRREDHKKDDRKYDDGDLSDIVDLHHVLRAKVKFTVQLEKDDDFSLADLAEWDKSVERSRERLNRALERADLTANGGADLKKLWKRREEKIAEMQDMGLLDAELIRVWKAKQSLLKQIYHVLQK